MADVGEVEDAGETECVEEAKAELTINQAASPSEKKAANKGKGKVKGKQGGKGNKGKGNKGKGKKPEKRKSADAPSFFGTPLHPRDMPHAH